MVVYFFIVWKLAYSASVEELVNDQLIMGKIAIAGALVIPLGLASSTFTSAIGSVLVAPRTLQALAGDSFSPRNRSTGGWLPERGKRMSLTTPPSSVVSSPFSSWGSEM